MINFDFYKEFRISETDISSESGKIKISHNKISDGNYASEGEAVTITASLPRGIFATEIRVLFFDGYNNEFLFSEKGLYIESDLKYDKFKFQTDSLKEIGLYFFFFEINADGLIYGYKSKNNILSFSFNSKNTEKRFQITVTKKENSEVIKGIMYHIFVDRFRRTENTAPGKNGVLIEDWYSHITEYPEYPGAYLKNNTFFGGTLFGVTEKLDYLASLGVSIIYLSPIFESPSNHKYDTADYEKIDEGFGGENAFRELIEAAQKRNIRVILDGVFNDTGADSIYFNKYSKYDSVGAFQSKNSPYYNWYRFTEYPEKYECWWGIDILPRIFYDSGDAEKYFLSKNGVIEKWMQKGILGFRLDVADELSDSFIEKIRNKISEYNKNALLYGEVWEDASNKIAYGVRKKYYLGNELSGVMNYPLRDGIIDYIRNKSCEKLDYAINDVIFNMPKTIREKTMNILGSHDTPRIISALSRENAESKSNADLSTFKMSKPEYEIAKRRVLSAYTLLTFLPGIPTVYYGDEVGVEGYRDPFNRKSFPWGLEDEEILNHFKVCGGLRKDDTLFNGDLYTLFLDRDILIIERKKGNKRFILIINNSQRNVTVNFTIKLTEVFSNKKDSVFILKPETSYIFQSEKICKIGCYPS